MDNDKIALVIGNSNYKNSPIRTAKNDAIDMAKFLRGVGFDVLEKYNLSFGGFWDAIKEFSQKLEKSKVRLLYFSGHGLNYEGKNYLLPTDLIINHPENIYQSINLQDLLKRFNIGGSSTNIFLLDCCNAKPTNFNFKSNDYIGFSNVELSHGSIIGFAAKAGSLAISDNSLRNSIYTSKLLENLKHPNLPIESILKNTMRDVVNYTNSKQTPAFLTEFIGDFYFIYGEGKLKLNPTIEVEKELKGYKDFITTLRHYKQHSKFDFIEKEEILSKKIGYELYKEHDLVYGRVFYYLYLYQGINQTITTELLQERYSGKFNNSNLLVFLPKEIDQKNYAIRKNNIKQKLNPLNIFYIDEFIKKLCTPKLFSEEGNTDKFLNLTHFVLPSYKLDNNNDNIDSYIEDWLKKENDPILIVKGEGGIGKTTLAYYIADKTKELKEQPSVLFIDSILIKDSLLNRKKDFLPITLFDFYEALRENSSTINSINEELFKLNIDSGNILIIIDGLDEVIAKIPDFEVNKFLNSIQEITKEIGGGKIIITCRTYFWDSLALLNPNLQVIELLPFNRKQIEIFFNKCFYQEPQLEKKAIKLAEEFKYPGTPGDYIYHPYVLDIIRSILKTNQKHIESETSDEVHSDYLNKDTYNDYIIYKICERERRRIGQIKTDDQIKFFVQFAIEKRGIIDTPNFSNFLFSSLKKHIDNTNVEAFKAHPFLLKSDKTVKFRYDFLTDFFKSIYLSLFFSYKGIPSEINDFFINILIENCRSGAGIIDDIATRTTKWDELNIINISDIIDNISNMQMDEENKRKSIATIFNICLRINRKFLQNNSECNTNLLKALFKKQNSNTIEKLSIINLYNSDTKIKFDFSDLVFNKCYFNNYDSFWQCRMNKNTKFIECHLLNLKYEKNISIDSSNFINCIKDNQVDKVFELSSNNSENKNKNTRKFLNDFFHLFFSNGKLGRQWEHKVIRPRFNGVNQSLFEYNLVIKVLKKQNIIQINEEHEGRKIAIHDIYKEDVIKFVKDGTNSEIIEKIIADLIKQA